MLRDEVAGLVLRTFFRGGLLQIVQRFGTFGEFLRFACKQRLCLFVAERGLDLLLRFFKCWRLCRLIVENIHDCVAVRSVREHWSRFGLR